MNSTSKAHFILLLTLNAGLIFSKATAQHLPTLSPSNRTVTNCAPAASSLSTLKGREDKIFQLSVDKTLWEKWGLCYPATYLFESSDLSQIEVFRRDTVSDPWQSVPTKTETDFYNGIEAVRIDQTRQLIYVSVGFKTSPTIFIRFNSPAKVTYKGIARYYDNRKCSE